MLTNLYLLSDKCWHNLGISAYLKCAHATCGNEVVGIPALEFLGQRAARVHKEQRVDDYHRSTYGSAHPPLPKDLAARHETLPAAMGEPRGCCLRRHVLYYRCVKM